ncbi:MAG: AAA family ATPase [Treponema sp.]|jgi:nitrogenase iron protein|nr:AAA family ATPase [Treponema sp.]
MPEIALYGKGGIGKSTIAANISAALGQEGKRVLQVGCDPKHDSTRLLLRGARITTVLDYLKERSPDQCRLDDIVHVGAFGVHCIEAGGPEPGIGCAGRGILSTFELMERLGIQAQAYDLRLYDVLGDVVCGGFAVPIRRKYADQVYIVSSGEFMALYAANNILRGLKKYDSPYGRAGGIILNSRGLEKEDERVRRFCDAVKLPLIATFPRSQLFAQSEGAGMCLIEAYPDSALAAQFSTLAARILHTQDRYPALPLSDEELEERILGNKPQPSAPTVPVAKVPGDISPNPRVKPMVYSKSLIAREPLYGCAFSGAMSITTQLEDCINIAHGPRSCAHITYQSITSVPRRLLLERGIVLPFISAPPVVSSEMNEQVMIFGGIDTLRRKIIQVKKQHPQVIFILTTCPSGIIGDDLTQVMDLEDQTTRIIPVLSDGNLQGDYLQGILLAYMELARSLIDRNLSPQEDTVNIVAEKPETNARAPSLQYIREILDAFGITINCHFICETSVEEIRRFKQGKCSILAYGDYMGRAIQSFLESQFQVEFFADPFPIGFRESCAWVRKLGRYFHKDPELAENLVSRYTRQYEGEIHRIKPILAGKSMMVITYNQNIDWILQTAYDLAMDIAFVGILNFSQDTDFTTTFHGHIRELHLAYEQDKRHADIRRIQPDLLLTNYGFPDQDPCIMTDLIPLSPVAGFLSGLVLALRWSEMVKMNLQEGWRQDELLFRKYRS